MTDSVRLLSGQILQPSQKGWWTRLTGGCLCICLAAVLFYSGYRAWYDYVRFQRGNILTVYGLGLATAVLYLLGQRSMLGLASGVQPSGENAMFVYLRSFESDSRWIGDLGPFRVLTSLLTVFGTTYGTYESLLSFAVGDSGKLLAVGFPKESLPPLGGRRLYAKGDWKKLVETLTNNASAVFLRPGLTEGLRWELQHLIDSCPPSKIFLCFPRRNSRAEYESFLEQSGRDFPIEFPSKLDGALFITFDPNWSPILLKPVRRSVVGRICGLIRSLLVSYGPSLRSALFEGPARVVPSRRRPFAWPEWLYWGPMIVIVLTIAGLVLLGPAAPFIYPMY